MPGIGVRTAARILLEVGEAANFKTSGHLAAYAGIAPVTRNSGTSIKGEHPASCDVLCAILRSPRGRTGLRGHVRAKRAHRAVERPLPRSARVRRGMRRADTPESPASDEALVCYVQPQDDVVLDL